MEVLNEEVIGILAKLRSDIEAVGDDESEQELLLSMSHLDESVYETLILMHMSNRQKYILLEKKVHGSLDKLVRVAEKQIQVNKKLASHGTKKNVKWLPQVILFRLVAVFIVVFFFIWLAHMFNPTSTEYVINIAGKFMDRIDKEAFLTVIGL